MVVEVVVGGMGLDAGVYRGRRRGMRLGWRGGWQESRPPWHLPKNRLSAEGEGSRCWLWSGGQPNHDGSGLLMVVSENLLGIFEVEAGAVAKQTKPF